MGHPWTGLGVVILGEFGLVFASVARGFREEVYLASAPPAPLPCAA